jgi:hypothetical protein
MDVCLKPLAVGHVHRSSCGAKRRFLRQRARNGFGERDARFGVDVLGRERLA